MKLEEILKEYGQKVLDTYYELFSEKNLNKFGYMFFGRIGGNEEKELRCARPCPVCSLALKEYGFKHIHYSTDHGFFYEYWG